MWRFAEIVLKWILSKLGTSPSAEDLTRILHQHLIDLRDFIGEMRCRSENIGLSCDHPEDTILKDIVKSEAKALKSLSRRLIFCEIKISRNIYQLRFFLARENCESIYHELHTILRNIDIERKSVLSTVDNIYLFIKKQMFEYVSLHGKFLCEHVQLLESIEANIQKSIDDVLSFSGVPHSRRA